MHASISIRVVLELVDSSVLWTFILLRLLRSVT